MEREGDLGVEKFQRKQSVSELGVLEQRQNDSELQNVGFLSASLSSEHTNIGRRSGCSGIK